MQKSVLRAVLGRMRLNLHANTSRRFALGAGNVCLVGENLTCSVSALQECAGLWSYEYGHAQTEYTPPHFQRSHGPG